MKLLTYYILVFSLSVVGLLATSFYPTCPEQFSRIDSIDGKCFRILQYEYHNYYEAESDCHRLGARIFVPESKAQDDSMTKYMKSAVKENKNGHWIGYVRAMTEKGKRSDANNWESTTTGSPLLKKNFWWHSGHPNTGKDEFCSAHYYPKEGVYADYCSKSSHGFYAVCEITSAL
ncbi:uncharacterized protein LOC142348468 [Convolutriloba macropyga]|uniref:uncharacterized protein LOC142348468 n=1 Tax=Convolutriloba macropyga TaxID=536237 RepID=UPI003F51B33F